ncbi:Diphthamide biosynthesis protein 2 [Cryptotrichosporon argae]
MSAAFSTPAEHAFEHTEIEASNEAGPSAIADVGELEEAFDVDTTVRTILDNGYKTIGLQFPDELLPSSVAVYRAIMRRVQHTGAQAYVLADSTYGSCCPDVLSCLHLPADFLVHYGHACLTPTDALPVHYVFPKRRLDVARAADSLAEATKGDVVKGVIVVWDVAHDWLADEITSTFAKRCPLPISFATVQRPSVRRLAAADDKGKAPAALRAIAPPKGLELSDCAIWYLGEEGRSLLNLQMTHAANPVYVFSSSTATATRLATTSRLLSRRLFALHSAMQADVFGLVVGNIGLASSRPLLDQLRAALRAARKKCYTLSVGRLNPAKLANFAAIECFVLVGCAEGGVVDSKDFLRPIITPYELTLALQGEGHTWDPANWTLDLGTVLETAHATAPAEVADIDAPQFSLINGAYRTVRHFGNARDAASLQAHAGQGVEGEGNAERALVHSANALSLRNQDFSLSRIEKVGSGYLAERAWRGLEPRVGMDAPAVLEQGRSGIARGYTEEQE